MSEPKKITRAEQKAMRPLQILDAAFDEFVQSGYFGARIERIAERVGVTNGTVYVYFGTKEILFEAMIDHISLPFAEFRQALAKLDGAPVQKIIKLLTLAYDYAEDRRVRESFRFVISEGLRFPELVDRHHAQFIEPIVAFVIATLVEGTASGEFREQPEHYPQLVIGPLVTTIILRLMFDSRKPIDKQAFVKAHADVLLHGLLKNGLKKGV
ncbi:TetR/AcrR family transcriptional regulator [Agrobacterium rosae]|uniref:TetR/AcrR family transcriptional regulator n=1 Tax=Agrobacterium rosae TaxID=1972867 RepID=UPI003A7F6B2E